MTDYLIRQLEDDDGVSLEVDGTPVWVPGGIRRVEVRRGFGLPARILAVTGFGDSLTKELTLGDTLRYDGWGYHDA